MALVKNLGADEVLDYKTPEGMRYKNLSRRKPSWCGGALGTLPTFGGLQSRACTRGHGDWHDADIQDHSQELVQQAHILKAQIRAIWDDTQCNRLTRGDRFGGGREAEGDYGFYVPIGEVSICLGL